MITSAVEATARTVAVPAYVHDLHHLDAHMAAIAAAMRSGPGRMEIYYAAEKLAKDPDHAHLIPYVEQMRAVYRRDFRTEIPER